MSSMNYVILLGGLTRDPELRHTGGGGSICKFSIAVTETYKDKAGKLANLICAALETGSTPDFAPVMYASHNRMPIQDRPYVYVHGWDRESFPDDAGQYHNLSAPRMTVADLYGPGFNSSYLAWQDEQRRYEELYKAREVQGRYYDHQENQPGHQTEEPPFPYTVKLGDTLDSIAIKFSARQSDIMKINPKIPPDGTVEPGMVLHIPWQ